MKIEKLLTPDALEAAYRFQKRQYLIEDAKNQYENYLNVNGISFKEKLTEKDYENLADQFDDKHDCNITDNDLWHIIIKNYTKTFTDIYDAVKSYLLSNKASTEQIENFLGFSVTTNLKDSIDDVLDQMPDDEILEFYEEYYKQ